MRKKRVQKPVISVLLPVYNNDAFLADCLKSLRAQSFRNFEIIAIDDDSTDNSYRLLLRAKKRDKRLKTYKNKKHYGLAITLNRILRKSKGAFLAFMSPCDVSLKNRLRQQIRFLQKNPKAGGVGTQCIAITKQNRRISRSSYPIEEAEIVKHLLSGSSMQPESVMVNVSRLPKDVLYFKPSAYPFIYTEVFVKCSQYASFYNLPKAYYLHRKTSYTNPSLSNLLPSFMKAAIKSIALYDHKPSLQSLLTPFLPKTA